MQYGSGQGVPELREQITEVMRLEGIEAHPDDVVVTVGSQQAVDLVTRVFCDPGDVVICEAPSYVGALGRLQGLPVRRRARRDGRRRAGARGAAPGDRRDPGRRQDDQVPLHDPQLPQPGRRDALGRAARGDPRDLPRARTSSSSRTTPTACSASTASRMRALRADEAEGVIYLGSFSKTFAPGFRVGWALAPAHGAREAGAGPGVGDAVPAAVLPDGGLGLPLQRTTGRARSSSSARCTASAATRWSTRSHDLMPAACRWNVPDGGFYVWLTLPPGVDAKAMLPRAVTARVAYVPGHRVLRRRLRLQRDAALVLLPDPRADPRGRTPAGRRPRGRDGAARDVRRLRRRPASSAARLRRPRAPT